MFKLNCWLCGRHIDPFKTVFLADSAGSICATCARNWGFIVQEKLLSRKIVDQDLTFEEAITVYNDLMTIKNDDDWNAEWLPEMAVLLGLNTYTDSSILIYALESVCRAFYERIQSDANISPGT